MNLEDLVKRQIGELVIQGISLQQQLEAAQAKLAKYEPQSTPVTVTTAEPSDDV